MRGVLKRDREQSHVAGKAGGSERPERKVGNERLLHEITKCKWAGVAVCCALWSSSVKSVPPHGVSGLETCNREWHITQHYSLRQPCLQSTRLTFLHLTIQLSWKLSKCENHSLLWLRHSQILPDPINCTANTESVWPPKCCWNSPDEVKSNIKSTLLLFCSPLSPEGQISLYTCWIFHYAGHLHGLYTVWCWSGSA